MLILTALLLSLAFAPVGQFYLAWIGLVPWLLVVRDARSHRSAFLFSWLGGTLFLIANMWWLGNVTVPGMIALLVYLGAFFGYAALILRGCRIIAHRIADGSLRPSRYSPPVAMLLFASIWTALEYIRGNWSMFGNQGLPWLNLGTTQTPFLNMCQVADFGGGYAVTFWVCIVNLLGFRLLPLSTVFGGEGRGKDLSVQLGKEKPLTFAPEYRDEGTRLSLITAALIVGCASVYGAWRMSQIDQLSPGPTVLVIQPNYKQDNSGAKGAPLEEIIDFHVRTTREALAECAVKNRHVDLVAWSETMMPPLNDSARIELSSAPIGETMRAAVDGISSACFDFQTAVVVGGMTYDDWQRQGDNITAMDRRNSAFLFNRGGTISSDRYDKIHLVPFGEFIPFQSISWIHAMLLKLGPSGYENYVLTPGNEARPIVFNMDGPDGAPPIRFATPICFEDLVSDLVARMVRGTDGVKRVDLLVNLTNDGWFMANEMPQHFQSAIFRSIENRVPTARTVNTGVSGFIDSMGRAHDTVAANQSGWSVSQVMLDQRTTFYTRYGDVFPIALTAFVFGLILYSIAMRRRQQT